MMSRKWYLAPALGLACLIAGMSASSLPSSITPCSRSLPSDQLSSCITKQARLFQKQFAQGLPEFNLEPLDPLTLTDINAVAGTFTIKSTNVVVKGLKKAEIREMKWDLKKKQGSSRVYGNFTFLSDYETEGRIFLIPIAGTGKLTVKMYDTEMVFKYKLRLVTGSDGVTHYETYDLKTSERYGNVKLHMSNILGGAVIGDTVNQVMNENWRDLMAEVGPTYTNAIAKRVHTIINQLYSQIPENELLAP